uniref:hypothetical protein n=1 Tax=Bakuella subtropica TaxID=1295181 RepID=UPI0023F23507|nr:hypothetical protein P4D19_mgp25 [Bakuella subtropica]WDY80876.1 hypothetical protein BKSUB_26 [Bakuella subtropica]
MGGSEIDERNSKRGNLKRDVNHPRKIRKIINKIDWFFTLKTKIYQVARRSRGNNPEWARVRKTNRLNPNEDFKLRWRPEIQHRFFCQVENAVLGKYMKWALANRRWSRDVCRVFNKDLKKIKFNSHFNVYNRRYLSSSFHCSCLFIIDQRHQKRYLDFLEP